MLEGSGFISSSGDLFFSGCWWNADKVRRRSIKKPQPMLFEFENLRVFQNFPFFCQLV
jgi:hypothetical protein